MNTTTLALPTVAGTPFGGGIYAGRYFLGASARALIVAPKFDGEHNETPWHKNLKAVAGALSYADGLANTDAMLAAGSPLAKWARALRIDEHDDWHLPSRLESLIAFGELKGTPDFDFELDWYWTSTQAASSPDYAWIQSFTNGFQLSSRKGSHCRARAVRSIPI